MSLSDETPGSGDARGERAEFHHRVKNNLQIVSTLLGFQARFAGDGAAAGALKDAKLRVHCIGLVHETLLSAADPELLDLDRYVHRLVPGLVRAHGAGGRFEVEIDVEPGGVPVDEAVPLGLILHELVTNGLRHGGSGGWLRVRSYREGRTRVLVVSDRGPGLPPGVDPTVAASLGFSLIRMLSAQLGGEVRPAPGSGATLALRYLAPGGA